VCVQQRSDIVRYFMHGMHTTYKRDSNLRRRLMRRDVQRRLSRMWCYLCGEHGCNVVWCVVHSVPLPNQRYCNV
jgi:hypothetical protein